MFGGGARNLPYGTFIWPTDSRKLLPQKTLAGDAVGAGASVVGAGVSVLVGVSVRFETVGGVAAGLVGLSVGVRAGSGPSGCHKVATTGMFCPD